MKKMLRKTALLVVLAIGLASFTGCSSECRTPLCTNNSQMTSDLCRSCNDALDSIMNIFGQ